MPPPEVLLPLGAGVAVLVVALMIALLVRRARHRRRADTAAAPPTVADAVQEATPSEAAWQEPPADPPHRAGSGRTVAAAVERAFAAREAQAGSRSDGPRADRSRGDARDRLLAVLLDDPVRAVGATVELEACRRQLDRLTDAIRHERAALADVLTRLSAAGLDDAQLARLSGLPDDELRRLLPQDADR